jgi:Zn-dependent protease
MIEQLYILPILLFSIVIHEIAHGWMALRLGDPTAKAMGRLTLNPIPHIDPVGSVLVPLFSLLAAGQVFIAWAKPVPVNPMNFRDYRRDDILVSIAGPVSNILMALVCSVVFIILTKLTPALPDGNPLFDRGIYFLQNMFLGGLKLNIVLAVFNMLPVPPLDGSHVVASLLPEKIGENFRRIGFYGIFLVLILMRWQPFAVAFNHILSLFLYPFILLIHAFA